LFLANSFSFCSNSTFIQPKVNGEAISLSPLSSTEKDSCMESPGIVEIDKSRPVNFSRKRPPTKEVVQRSVICHTDDHSDTNGHNKRFCKAIKKVAMSTEETDLNSKDSPLTIQDEGNADINEQIAHECKDKSECTSSLSAEICVEPLIEDKRVPKFNEIEVIEVNEDPEEDKIQGLDPSKNKPTAEARKSVLEAYITEQSRKQTNNNNVVDVIDVDDSSDEDTRLEDEEVAKIFDEGKKLANHGFSSDGSRTYPPPGTREYYPGTQPVLEEIGGMEDSRCNGNGHYYEPLGNGSNGYYSEDPQYEMKPVGHVRSQSGISQSEYPLQNENRIPELRRDDTIIRPVAISFTSLSNLQLPFSQPNNLEHENDRKCNNFQDGIMGESPVMSTSSQDFGENLELPNYPRKHVDTYYSHETGNFHHREFYTSEEGYQHHQHHPQYHHQQQVIFSPSRHMMEHGLDNHCSLSSCIPPLEGNKIT
jgi:hypothetical protein